MMYEDWGEGERTGALKSADLLLGHPSGGVSIAAVLERSVPALLISDQLLGIHESIGGGADDRRREGIRDAGAADALTFKDK